MIMKKILICAIVALSSLFFACSKNDDAKDLTKDEATSQIQATNANLKKEIAEIQSNKGVVAMMALTNLGEIGIFPSPVAQLVTAEGLMEAVSSRSNPFKSVVKSAEGGFGFNSKKGKYTYTNGEFVRDNSVTDRIVILFPSNGKTVNNSELTITSFEEQFSELEEDYIPIKIEAELKVDNATVLKISYKSVLGNLASQGLEAIGVASFDLSILLAPYAIESHQSLSISNTGYATKDNSFIRNNSKMLLSTGRDLAVTVNKSTGAATFKGNSFFQVSNLKLSGSISYSGTPDTESGFSYVLNKINLSLYKYPEGNKVGTILLEEGAVPMIAYNDGTRAPLENIFSELIKGLVPQE